MGYDPSVVVHRADLQQFAPYDIESVDENGVRVYIEVKATSGDDPSAPFDISHAELMQAIRHGDRYRIYRVTSARSSSPHVTAYLDPIALVRSGKATLDTASARMRFGADE